MTKTLVSITLNIFSIAINSFAFFFFASIAQILLNMVLAPFGFSPLSWLESTGVWAAVFGLSFLVKRYGD